MLLEIHELKLSSFIAVNPKHFNRFRECHFIVFYTNNKQISIIKLFKNPGMH